MFLHRLIGREFLGGDEKKAIEQSCARPFNVGNLRDELLIFLAYLSLQRAGEFLAVSCDKRGFYQHRGTVKILEELLFSRAVVAHYLTWHFIHLGFVASLMRIGEPSFSLGAERLPSLAAMERSGIAIKCKALLDDPFYPTISRAT